MFVGFLLLIFSFSALLTSSSRPPPYGMRISCGARHDVRTPAHNAIWHKDFAYTGGIPSNGTLPSDITPPLSTVRYFPLSEGLENCYNINRVPHGHYAVRIFFGLVDESNFTNEPLFDVSVEGTQIYSLKSGWSKHNNEQAFAEGLLFLTDGTASICFHSTGHGDPSILSIEILQVDARAYYFGPHFGQGTILRTVKRLSCGAQESKFDADYKGDPWGGDRFWKSVETLNSMSDRPTSTKNMIKQASILPNFYPEALYQTALLSTVKEPDLAFSFDVEPSRNYTIWLHFAEIDSSFTSERQRVFDILINDVVIFTDLDIMNISGHAYTAVVLNKTVAVNGRSITVKIHPTKGSYALINAIEVFEVIRTESNTLPDEVRALRALKKAMRLPLRFGWNGDPCVPQQHPWTGVDCQYDRSHGKWVIDGLGLDNQGLNGFLPNQISDLRHLKNINLSGNSIRGEIPPSLGNISPLETFDLSYNSFNGSIPDSLGRLTSLKRLNLNSNFLTGKISPAFAGLLLHRASFNFTDNAGLCGIPGLPACKVDLSPGAKIGIGLISFVGLLLILTFSVCWWKRRQNVLRVQRIATRESPYAKARTHFSRDIQMSNNARTAAENGPSLLT